MSATDLKQLWQSQPTLAADPNEIMAKAARLRQSVKRKTWLGNILLAITLAFVVFVLIYYKPQMWTTKTGILLVVIGIVMQIIAAGKLIPLTRNNQKASPSEYLSQLLLIQKKQAYLQTTIMNLYFILLGSGIFLYLYEYAVRMDLLGMILTYGLTALWFAISWFYLRPRTIRKQNAALEDAIRNLENINRQFTEEQ